MAEVILSSFHSTETSCVIQQQHSLVLL